jgi:hypothetical protein
MERYDSLVKDRDVMNEDCDAANAQLVKEQAAAVEEIKVGVGDNATAECVCGRRLYRWHCHM